MIEAYTNNVPATYGGQQGSKLATTGTFAPQIRGGFLGYPVDSQAENAGSIPVIRSNRFWLGVSTSLHRSPRNRGFRPSGGAGKSVASVIAIVDTAAMAHSQERAIAHVRSLATGGPVDPSLRVTLHFHPDRLVVGVPILELVARDGVYRSQFETGTSNGGLTAHPGGDRWRWESRIFAGAYDDAAPADRPKYGSLNFRRRLVGGSPRFGSAHLRLAAHTLACTTFCYPDSVFEPRHVGVVSRLSTLIALAEADDKDPLDDYIEAHVHGVVDLSRDVEALVLDPCYRDTPVETSARRLACPVEWHGGFTLTTGELRRYPEYRGPEFVDLGVSLARDSRLDPRIIGDASRTGQHDEQALKRVWHYVARFGTPEMREQSHE